MKRGQKDKKKREKKGEGRKKLCKEGKKERRADIWNKKRQGEETREKEKGSRGSRRKKAKEFKDERKPEKQKVLEKH